ncbi:hypothetical protein D3C77_301340 [compost metagenome]
MGLECLNKSAIVLILATWEAFVEDLAENAFECMLANASKHNVFPQQVLDLAWKAFKSEPTQDALKKIEAGWREIFKHHKSKILAKYIERGSFNTPSAANIDYLFAELIGLNSMSSNWRWRAQRQTTSVNKLQRLIELRGAIAHRAAAEDAVVKMHVLEYSKLVVRLAAKSHNAVRAYLETTLGFIPCVEFSQGDLDVLIARLDLFAAPAADAANDDPVAPENLNLEIPDEDE